MIKLKHNDLAMVMKKPGFHSSILELVVGNKKHKVMLKDYQSHVVKKQILHMDFLYVKSNEKMQIEVPLVFVGMEKNAAINGGGILSQTISSVEVSCMPSNLPENIEVDVSSLALDSTFHYSDFKLPKGVTLVASVDGEHNLPVASIHMPKVSDDSVNTVEDNDGEQEISAKE